MNLTWNLCVMFSAAILVMLVGRVFKDGESQPLVVTPTAVSTVPDVRTAKLETMIAKSDSIVVAKVSETISLQTGARIAKARVEQILKGPKLEAVFYQIDLNMLEDVSAAQIGEEVVLFLYRPRLRSPSDYPPEIKNVTGQSPLFLIYHLGRGRFVTVTAGSKRYLSFRRGSRVILPDEIPVTWGFESSDPDLGKVALEDFTKYVEKQTARTGGH